VLRPAAINQWRADQFGVALPHRHGDHRYGICRAAHWQLYIDEVDAALRDFISSGITTLR
jgi:hypothetical protein